MKILWIDDNESILSTFKEMLEAEGHTVDTATTGVRGLQMIREANFAKVPYGVLFTDLDLGPASLDGWKILDILANTNYLRKFLVTGNNLTPTQLDRLSVAKAEYLVKGLDLTEKVLNLVAGLEITANGQKTDSPAI